MLLQTSTKRATDLGKQPGINGIVHAFPRGKVLGGSSAINYMMYVRGQAAEYDDWVRLSGYSNWGWSGLKPFFMKSESMVAPTPEADHNDSGAKVNIAYETESHGNSGPIKTSFGNWSPPVADLWHEASKAMGLQWTPPKDAWSGTHLGGYSNLSTIDRSQGPGTRSYSANGYLTPNAKRNNLMVLTEAVVARIVLDCDRHIPAATGVVVLKDGQERIINAKREIIIAAGVVQTPQILELSGIGRRDILENVGLQCIVDSERVGEQFEDHPVTVLSYDLVDGEFSLDQLTQQAVMGEAMQKYGMGQGGPLANGINDNGFAAIAQIATMKEKNRISEVVNEEIESAGDRWTREERKILAKRIMDPQAASIQLAILPASTDPSHFDDQTKLLAPGIGNNRCSIIVAASHPFSRGSIHIQSTDATVQPRIDPQYLQSKVDVEILSVGLRIADEMFRTKPLADAVRARVFPAPDMDMDDPAQREDYLRKHTGTEYHPCGTAALGQVVDERLRVFSVDRLRVVDASIIPLHLSGNICALVYAIAEKAADMIKEDQRDTLS